ncbi:hypothetical protein M1555_02740 [Patescibacteria group bacterium]|nr:hypothetical protein [Patescibacteria group bacterium]
MKPQDFLFVILFAVLLILRRPRLLVFAGLGCLLLAIPLFAGWIFFTAERLTWYAAAFFLTFIVLSLVRGRKVQ